MKQYRSTQGGYVLLYVLLTIVLIGLFIPPLMNAILTSNQQYKKTEEILQHEKLAEMGTVFFEKTVIDIIKNWTPSSEDVSKDPDYIKQYVLTYLEDELQKETFDSDFLNTSGYTIAITEIGLNNTSKTIAYRLTTTFNQREQKIFDQEMSIPNVNFISSE
ncbi:hypothetical protein [Sutcliffiella rhizosphaerae]|uniref:Type II secretion system protein n=1 Tax=Sutcliffiella rhizosphaerae TaxID=2880967 RepID=A0ABM8YID6_9BACI|nr:hypothetical protein [Sutcliffiella rhizosphaerae]CAG9619495.1 hypothetical protein BACCIP111883_00262 [Sutcliffiella rhizosphaerae]